MGRGSCGEEQSSPGKTETGQQGKKRRRKEKRKYRVERKRLGNKWLVKEHPHEILFPMLKY